MSNRLIASGIRTTRSHEGRVLRILLAVLVLAGCARTARACQSRVEEAWPDPSDALAVWWGQVAQQPLRDELPEEQKLAYLERLGIRLTDFLGRLDWLHTIDFSGDDVPDVIYNGGARVGSERLYAGEGVELVLVLAVGSSAVQVLRAWGRLVQLLPPARPAGAAPIRIENVGCCADRRVFVERYEPEGSGAVLRYRLTRRVMKVDRMSEPTQWFREHRRFRVDQEAVTLCTAPEPCRDLEDRPPDLRSVIAQYGRGARGLALAEKENEAGEVWWFVVMDGRTPPVRTPHRGDPSGTIHPGFPTDRLGWMSSRLVAEVGPSGR